MVPALDLRSFFARTVRLMQKGTNPLGLACDRGKLDMVQLLLRHGADVNSRDPEATLPLFKAIFRGHLCVVRELLAAGANPNGRDEVGHNPLHWLAHGGMVEVSKRSILAACSGLCLFVCFVCLFGGGGGHKLCFIIHRSLSLERIIDHPECTTLAARVRGPHQHRTRRGCYESVGRAAGGVGLVLSVTTGCDAQHPHTVALTTSWSFLPSILFCRTTVSGARDAGYEGAYPSGSAAGRRKH